MKSWSELKARRLLGQGRVTIRCEGGDLRATVQSRPLRRAPDRARPELLLPELAASLFPRDRGRAVTGSHAGVEQR